MKPIDLELPAKLSPVLKGKKILIGITGSIAAYKIADLVRLLKKAEANVRIILSETAEHFVTALTLETLSESAVVFHSLKKNVQGMQHIEMARWADLTLIAPTTANFIAKMAVGLADDLLTTELLAFSGPTLIAPSMNPSMFQHPTVQENLARLRTRGIIVLGPNYGSTACHEEGLGRMMEPEDLLEEIAENFYEKNSLNQKRLLITLGATQSFIDPIRYFTNRSSGKMGSALCWTAVQKGYSVTALTGIHQTNLPKQVQIISTPTSSEMANAAQSLWKNSDLFIGAAAVLDLEIEKTLPQKWKKELGTPPIKFKLARDTLKEIGLSKKSNQFVIGFAAETENSLENARLKLKNKKCDAIFVNDISQKNIGFESDLNAGWFIEHCGQETYFETVPKIILARQLFEKIKTMLL